MKLGLKINLFALVVPALMALIIIFTGISVMNRVVYNLNQKLIINDLNNIAEFIESDHQVLKKAGVDDYPLYIERAKSDFLKTLRERNFQTEGELFILDTLSDASVYPVRPPDSRTPRLRREDFPYISGAIVKEADQGDFYINYIKIPYWNWIVMILISSEEMFAEINNYLNLVIPLSLVPLLSGLILTFFFLRNVFERINDSLSCLKEVETGNLGVRIATGAVSDEIDEIQLAINKMIGSLRYSYQELESRVESRTAELAETNSRLMEEIQSGNTAREEISYLNNYLKNIIDSMPTILIGINRDSRISKWNPEAEKVSGMTEQKILGKSLEELIGHDHELISVLREHFKNETPITDFKVKLKLGESGDFHGEISYFPLSEKLNEMGILQIRDITEKFNLEELIKQSEKMLSVGGLAAGMAHEINNPLAGMMQSAQNIKRRLNGGIPVNIRTAESCGTTMEAVTRYSESRHIPEMVQSILDSGKRAAEIVDNMIIFSHNDAIANSLHKVDEILTHALNDLKMDGEFRDLFTEGRFNIFIDFEDDLPLIPCEKKKLEQAFYNIMRNALQALISSGTEQPTIRLDISKRDDSLRIEIEDNGPGIDDSIRKRIFEPFFSTKDVNQGKGLGLSISYYIIRDHHRGNLWLEQKSTGGSLFVISLPVATGGDLS